MKILIVLLFILLTSNTWCNFMILYKTLLCFWTFQFLEFFMCEYFLFFILMYLHIPFHPWSISIPRFSSYFFSCSFNFLFFISASIFFLFIFLPSSCYISSLLSEFNWLLDFLSWFVFQICGFLFFSIWYPNLVCFPQSLWNYLPLFSLQRKCLNYLKQLTPNLQT